MHCTAQHHATPRHATRPRQVNLEAQERALFEPRAVSAWFSCDVRLGQLTITLEPPGCFAAEEYAQVWAWWAWWAPCRGACVLSSGQAGKAGSPPAFHLRPSTSRGGKGWDEGRRGDAMGGTQGKERAGKACLLAS